MLNFLNDPLAEMRKKNRKDILVPLLTFEMCDAWIVFRLDSIMTRNVKTINGMKLFVETMSVHQQYLSPSA